MDFSARISGEEDLLAAMGRLPRAVRNRMLRPGLRAGGEVMRLKAVANVKRVAIKGYSKGLLARSIIARNARQKQGMLRVVVAVSAKKFYPNGTRVGLVGSVLEHGKSDQVPEPWLRPAASSSGPEVYTAVVNVARQNLNKAITEARR